LAILVNSSFPEIVLSCTMLRCAKQNYFRKLNPRDPMTFWKTVKLVNKNNQPIPTLSHDGRIANIDGEKVNMLNTFLILALTNHTLQLLSVIHPTSPVQMMCCVVGRRCVTSWLHWTLPKQVARMVFQPGCLGILHLVSPPHSLNCSICH